MNVHKHSSLGLQVFKDEFIVVTSSGGGVGRHLLCRGGMSSMNVLYHTSNTIFKYNIQERSCFTYPCSIQNYSDPTVGAKNVTQ